MKNPRTPNLRAQVAGEVAMEAHPTPTLAGAGVRSQRTHHKPVTSECRSPSPLSRRGNVLPLFPFPIMLLA